MLKTQINLSGLKCKLLFDQRDTVAELIKISSCADIEILPHIPSVTISAENGMCLVAAEIELNNIVTYLIKHGVLPLQIRTPVLTAVEAYVRVSQTIRGRDGVITNRFGGYESINHVEGTFMPYQGHAPSSMSIIQHHPNHYASVMPDIMPRKVVSSPSSTDVIVPMPPDLKKLFGSPQTSFPPPPMIESQTKNRECSAHLEQNMSTEREEALDLL